jgi:hypothetical protein
VAGRPLAGSGDSIKRTVAVAVPTEPTDNALGRRRPHTQEELIGDTHSYLRSRQRTPRIVANYFEENQVSYAKAP